MAGRNGNGWERRNKLKVRGDNIRAAKKKRHKAWIKSCMDWLCLPIQQKLELHAAELRRRAEGILEIING